MRLMRFNIKAKYVPGKDMLVADTLSRSPVSTTESNSHWLRKFKPMSADVLSSWQLKSVSDAGLAKIRAETLKDVNLNWSSHGVHDYSWLASV